MPINFSQLITSSYWLDRFVVTLSREFFIAWLVLSLVFIAAAILIYFESSRRRLPPAWSAWTGRLVTMLSVMGVVSLVLLFFRYQRSPFFSMRLWMLLWAIGLLGWSLRLAIDAYRKVPPAVAAWRDRQRIEKYLPKH